MLNFFSSRKSSSDPNPPIQDLPPRKGLHYRRLLMGCFWLLLWLLALFVTGNLLLGWLRGDHYLTVRLVNYLLPWFFFFLLAALMPAVLNRRTVLTVALAVPTLAIAFYYLPVFLPNTHTGPSEHAQLKVMSYNVWSRNRTMELAADLIRKENPDILLLQEVLIEQMRELQRLLSAPSGENAIEWNFIYSPHLLQAVASRYPLKQLMTSRKKGKVLAVLVESSVGEIEVFNVHPLRGNWERRHRQLEDLLREDILTAGSPVILGGDFNTTDKGETYRLLSRHLRNAHWEAGWGFGFSYPANRHAWQKYLPAWPLVRIDHIFYSPDFTAFEAETLANSAGSDHFPVVTSLTLNKEGPQKNQPPSSRLVKAAKSP